MMDPSSTTLFIATRVGAVTLVEIARQIVGDRGPQEVGARRAAGAAGWCAVAACIISAPTAVSTIQCGLHRLKGDLARATTTADGDARSTASGKQHEQHRSSV